MSDFLVNDYEIPFVGGYYDGASYPANGPIDLLWVFPHESLRLPAEMIIPIAWETAVEMPAFKIEQPFPIYHYRKLGGVYQYQGPFFPGKNRTAGLSRESLKFMRKSLEWRLQDLQKTIAEMLANLQKGDMAISEVARRITEEDIKHCQEELEDFLETYHRLYPPIL